MERLDKIIAATGRWSRKEAAELIRTGRVLVDGEVVTQREAKFSPDSHFVVDGIKISGEKYTYLMLHKPAGLVSATEDPREPTEIGRASCRIGLFPAGRLDKDTVGLLLLTNDGPLAHALLSPARHVDKQYLVRVEGTFDEGDIAAFRAGLTLPDGLRCLPAELEPLGPNEALITLREGKYHQIKRMCAHRGKPVTFLKRLTFGPLKLDEALAPGQWRPLRSEELTALKGAGPTG